MSKQFSEPHKTTSPPPKPAKWTSWYPLVLIFGGLIGLVASMELALDKIKLLQNPNYSPICNLNPILSCVSVTSSSHATTFGIPNAYTGLAVFAVLITVGMAILAGARFKKWFWLGLELGTLAGVGFVHFLYFQSVYNIGKLCLYCMAVWIIVIAIFWYTTLYNLNSGNLPVSKKADKTVAFMQKHHLDILILWYLVIAATIIHHFWYYISA